MSTYLVTFVVGEFSFVNTTSVRRGIPIRAFATPDKLDQTHFALEMAKHTLDKYEELYKIDYPLPKQVCLGVPVETDVAITSLIPAQTDSEINLFFHLSLSSRLR